MEGSLDWARDRAEKTLEIQKGPSLEKEQPEALDEIIKAAENEPT